MNKDQAKGTVENIKGRVKEAAGSLSGDKKTQVEGTAERVEGAARKKVGDVKHDVGRQIDESDDEAKE
jgi:uncharacterized protein YjbJ (UPF0337 family)